MSDSNKKTKIKQYAGVGAAVVGLTVLTFGSDYITSFQADKAPKVKPVKKAQTVTPGEKVDDNQVFNKTVGEEVKQVKENMASIAATLKTTQDQLGSFVQQNEELKNQLRSLAANQSSPQAQTTNPDKTPDKEKLLKEPLPGGKRGVAQVNNLEDEPTVYIKPKREIEVSTRSAKPAINQTQKKQAYVLGASYAGGFTLNGVYAPTSPTISNAQSGDCMPLVFEISRPLKGPVDIQLDLRGWRATVCVWGELSDHRVHGRLVDLFGKDKAGNAVVVNDVKGKLMGDDGFEGIPGELITKSGTAIANAMIAGFGTGLGQGIQRSTQVISSGGFGVNSEVKPGEIGKAMLGGGVSEGSRTLHDYFIKLADKQFPVIATDGGVKGTIMFTKSFTINGDLEGVARTNTQVKLDD